MRSGDVVFSQRLRPEGAGPHPHLPGSGIVVVNGTANHDRTVGDVVNMRRRLKAVHELDKDPRRHVCPDVSPEISRFRAEFAARGIQRNELNVRSLDEFIYRTSASRALCRPQDSNGECSCGYCANASPHGSSSRLPAPTSIGIGIRLQNSNGGDLCSQMLIVRSFLIPGPQAGPRPEPSAQIGPHHLQPLVLGIQTQHRP